MKIKNQINCRAQGKIEKTNKIVGDPIRKNAEYEKVKLDIYEGKSKAWYLIIIILTETPFGLVRQCGENVHESWKAIIDKYDVSG